MYVCLCRGITDNQIRQAINEGCASYGDVRSSLGIGTQCGKCACLAKQVVKDTLTEAEAARYAVLAAQANFVAA